MSAIIRLLIVCFVLSHAAAVRALEPAMAVTGFERCDGGSNPDEPPPPESRRCGGNGSGEESPQPPDA